MITSNAVTPGSDKVESNLDRVIIELTGCYKPGCLKCRWAFIFQHRWKEVFGRQNTLP